EQEWTRSDSSVRNVILKGNLADLLQRYATGTYADPGQPMPAMTKSATRLLYITDVAGALVASLNDLAPYANAHQPWWQHTFNKGVGQPSISDLAFDDRVGVYTFTLSLPILDSIRYEAVGVLHRVYDAAEFFAPLVHPIRFGKTGHVMIIDSAGRVLSCPILPTGTTLSDADLIPMVTKPQPGWVRAPSDGHGHTGTSIIGFASLPATSRITAQATGRRWHTFVWQSSTELFGPVQHLLGWISVFGAVAVGLLVILGYVAAGRIVTPVRRLQHAAQLIGRGELKEPLVIRTGDEFEDLAEEINRMNAQLELAFAGLTDQVERKSLEVQYLKHATDQILDHVSTPILMLDDEDRIQYVNRAAADAFALPDTDPLAGTLFDVLPLEAKARDLLREEVQAYRTQP
ncbi:MAG: cache domain-containing protein, partial [Nitrospirales bacterium]